MGDTGGGGGRGGGGGASIRVGSEIQLGGIGIRGRITAITGRGANRMAIIQPTVRRDASSPSGWGPIPAGTMASRRSMAPVATLRKVASAVGGS